jgi:hypothetical protein
MTIRGPAETGYIFLKKGRSLLENQKLQKELSTPALAKRIGIGNNRMWDLMRTRDFAFFGPTVRAKVAKYLKLPEEELFRPVTRRKGQTSYNPPSGGQKTATATAEKPSGAKPLTNEQRNLIGLLMGAEDATPLTSKEARQALGLPYACPHCSGTGEIPLD